MKTMLLAFLLCLSQIGSKNTDDLVVQVTNIKVLKGNIVVSLYDKADDFPKSGRFCKRVTVPITGNKVTCKVKNVAHGEYAVAVFHDKNADTKFNQNFIGLPLEAYGFTHNIRPQFSAPDYKDVKFNFPKENNFSIALIH